MDDKQIKIWKRAAADAAVSEVGSGMLIGLGTGSTAAFAVDALASRVRSGLDCRVVVTSLRTERQAVAAGIKVLPLEKVARVDLAIDGVDEIDPGLRAIKGAGGAMLREKVVATAAMRMIAIADATKAVDRLGARPVPVEALPVALAFVTAAIAGMGARPLLRERAGKAVLTDQRNLIIDCHFAEISDPAALARKLSQVPGMLGHGLFIDEIDALYVGGPDGVTRVDRPAAA